MSLIITSSSQDDSYDFVGNINIENAYSYQNYFKTPIKIKPNSQIAVESIKVERSTTIDMNNDDKLSLYIGKELTSESTNLLSYPIHLNLGQNLLNVIDVFRPRGNIKSNLSRIEAATRLQNVFNEGLLHPVFHNGASVTVQRDSTTNLFKGFDISLTQISGSNVSDVISTSFISADQETEELNFDYNTNTFTRQAITSTGETLSDNVCCGIGADRPILNSGGSIVYDISQVSASDEGWVVGLSRSARNYDILDFPNTPHYYDDHAATSGFCDYFVKWDGSEISVGYMAADSTNEELYYFDEVKYYYPSGDFTAPITDLSEKSKIKFTVLNEDIRIEIYDEDEDEYMPLVDRTESSNKESLVKPTNQNLWAMFPYIQLLKQNTEIIIEKQSGLNAVNYDCSYMNWYTMATAPMDENFSPVVCWNMQEPLSQEMDTLSINDPTIAGATYTPLGLNVSNGVDYKIVLLLGSNNIYNNTSIDGFSPNTNQKLGYGVSSIINQTTFATVTGLVVKFSSLEKPSSLSTRSFFVRLNTTAHNSFNGAISGISKILSHFPTTDNSGRDEGILFFEKSNMIYLDLNNTTEISLQDMKIDLVHINENFATSFVGNTIVVFHIREKPN